MATGVSKDIADYLETQSIGTVGTDIFAGTMPETPDDCIAVMAYAGSPPDRVANEFENSGVQVLVRSTAYSTGWTTANSIYQLLHGLTRTTINSKLYYYVWANGSIMQMGTDKTDRHLFVINFTAMKELD